ncbi:MAG TPA: DUF3592 domain-containing protein [Solirubrobacter sp.]|nr:DUF3592 domain-containing protein [Solirubrobacter sp.]
MLARLLLGIFAITLLPMGVVFGVIGLVADDVDRGSPEAFLYLGIVFTVVAAALAVGFGVLQRRELARRRRRRAGLRTRAEIVRVRLNPSVHSGARVSTHLTVRFAGAGEVSTPLFALPHTYAEDATIDVVYDPAEPANFEPVSS